MRPFLALLGPALFCLPLPALADTLLATSRITAVTVYPQGAEISRDVTFTGTAGAHELLVTDLPAATEPSLIRLEGGEGLGLGAWALRTDRLPPRDAAEDGAMKAAKAAVETAEATLRAAEAATAAIRARIEAAEAQIAFLGRTGTEGALTAEGLKSLSDTIGTQVLAAREAALAAAADLPAADKAVAEAQEALAKANAARDALSQRDETYAALSVSVTLAAEGPSHLTIRHFVEAAGWQPVYDLHLTRKGGVALTLDRGVLVSQSSGEDWAGVNLTLSTAQPSTQAAPSQLWPELRRIEPPMPMAKAGGEMMVGAAAPQMDMAMAEPAVTASAAVQGDVVVYHYPSPVDVASGVENLRLALDRKTLTAEVEARAVPRADRTAFLLAKFTNDTGEILLPGEAYLTREGTLAGSLWLDTLAPGAEAEIGFGAIEGLRLSRDMPLRSQGDRGILTTSTQIEEKAVLKVENLTDETWPVRLLDQVPYSEQEDLEISFSADPAPAETDVDGQRGILAWKFDIAPGEKKEITLDSLMRWPEGMELR